MQAKDILDVDLLSWLNKTQIKNNRFINAWDFVGTEWDEPEIPYKILWAKLTELIKHDFIDGCVCGCRGGFSLTPLGMQFIKTKEFNKFLVSLNNVFSLNNYTPKHAKKHPNIFKRIVMWVGCL